MNSFLNDTEILDNLFKRLRQMQTYLYDIKKLESFNLPKPVCLHNAYTMNVHYLNKKWLDKFPSLQTVEKLIEGGKKLFFLPEQIEHNYLYYHLLIAYKNFQEYDSMKIYDDETPLDYDSISTYLSRNNLVATEFLEKYFLKGLNFHKKDFVYSTVDKSVGEAVDYVSDEDITHKMTTEPTAPPLELEPETEVAKMVSPVSFTAEKLQVEKLFPEEKKVKENQIF